MPVKKVLILLTTVTVTVFGATVSKRSIFDNEINPSDTFVPVDDRLVFDMSDYYSYWLPETLDPNYHSDSLVSNVESDSDENIFTPNNFNFDLSSLQFPVVDKFEQLRGLLEEALDLLDVLEKVNDISNRTDDLYLRCFMKKNIGNLWRNIVKKINPEALASEECGANEDQETLGSFLL